MAGPKILAVDDEPLNIEFLTCCLSGAGFTVVTANDGVEALQRFAEHPDVDAVLLDRMMPRMDGMQVLARLKQDGRYNDLPVIMQTAAASKAEVMEGIEAGVYYYLAKPYEHSMLLCIVRAALQDAQNRKTMREEAGRHRRALGLIEQARFRFRTLEEAQNLAYYAAGCFPDPQAAVWGLSELMVNAIEHGNLGISYAEKTALMLADAWQQEVERRLSLKENLGKYVRLTLDADEQRVRARISDCGEGFNWKHYLEIAPERAAAPHGRGIAIARLTSFSSLCYLGRGSEVECVQHIDAGRSIGANFQPVLQSGTGSRKGNSSA